jgi:type I restriction enzyme, R subunit
MSDVGQRERPVQDRVVLLFADRLEYRYLGNRQYRPGNSNIEQEDLRAWLLKQGTSETLITRPAQAQGGRSCRRGQDPLRGEPRGLPAPPLRRDFAVAEEVTVFGNLTKRPDVVLYVNGIALGVLELKRSTVSVGEGIRKRALSTTTWTATRTWPSA